MKNGEEDQRYVFVSLTEKGREAPCTGRLARRLLQVLERVRERMGGRCLH